MTNENKSFVTTTSINKQGLGIFSTTGTFNVRLRSNNLGMYVNFNKYIKDLKDYDNVHKKIMLKFDKGEIINLTGTLSTDGKAVFFNDLDKNILLKKMIQGSNVIVRTYDYQNIDVTYIFSLIGFTKNFRKLKYIGQKTVKKPNIILLPNGDKYEGEFKNEKFHGQGKYSFSNGNIYEGEFKDGKWEGLGKYSFNHGNIYEGEFKNGKFHGLGKYSFSNGNIYEGEFKDGKSHGLGSVTLPDGDTFVGYFKDGKPWNVKIYDKNGNIIGKYVNGEWIKQ